MITDIEIKPVYRMNQTLTNFTCEKPALINKIFDTSFAEKAEPFYYNYSPQAYLIFYQNRLRSIEKITFPISRYGKYSTTFIFNNYMTLEKAMQKVEEYLSVPLTIEYFEKIKDDVFFDDYEDYFLINECPNRGTVLSTNNFLLNITIPDDDPNAVYL